MQYLINFEKTYGELPQYLAVAPGRAELLGNHTDYNNGFVLGIIMPFSTTVLSTVAHENKINLFSENFQEQYTIELDKLRVNPIGHWSDYIMGVIWQLKKIKNDLNGLNVFISSDIPIGAGMSSSAALELSTAAAIAISSSISLTHKEFALLCYRAEHDFVKSDCGILDQFVSALGTRDKAIFIDCQSQKYQYITMPKDVVPVMVHTGIIRSAGDILRLRKREVQQAIQMIKKNKPIDSLRELTAGDLDFVERILPANLYHRVKHVILENERVLQMREALTQSDFSKIRELMYKSHLSSKNLYGVSIPELDILVDIAYSSKYAIGSRLSGAGLGGCTINLVFKDKINEFTRYITKAYFERTRRMPKIYYGEEFKEFHMKRIQN